jgi:ech hydrogenase subunit C
MPDPKFVLVVGVCGCSGGVYHGCYNSIGGVDKVIPVDVYVGGCPPRPSEIIDGVVQILGKIPKTVRPDSSTVKKEAMQQ